MLVKTERKSAVFFTKHAREQFLMTSEALGLKTSPDEIEKVFKKATPEKILDSSVRFNLFKRSIVHGDAKYYVADGWRFVVAGDKVVTVERIRPHENHKYLKNFIPKGRR